MQFEFNDICKQYDGKPVLRHVRLGLSVGDCCLVTGENGAGKSTLFRICAGLEKPDAGFVAIDGKQTSWKMAQRALQSQTVYLHQDPYMFDGSVIYNLKYGIDRTLNRAERKTLIEQALEWARLQDLANRSAKTLSGGERQRVAIARGWLRKPDLMFLDEPTSSLDELSRHRTHELLSDLKQAGMTLVIASHEPQHFVDLANLQKTIVDGAVQDANAQTAASTDKPVSLVSNSSL